LPSFYGKLLKDFDNLSRSLGALPSIPSEEDKKTLKKLEKLKVSDPFDSRYDVENRAPLVSGIAPERIHVEVREHQNVHLITYWYFWSYDRFPRDHENWEPVTLACKSSELIRIDARVHDSLISYAPQIEDTKPKVYFYRIGHTPVLQVKDRKNDIVLDQLKDGLDYTRRKWLNLCYQHAQDDEWKPLAQPKLECKDEPILDGTHWKRWGKHSIYVRI
jgi:hypothetical protein